MARLREAGGGGDGALRELTVGYRRLFVDALAPTHLPAGWGEHRSEFSVEEMRAATAITQRRGIATLLAARARSAARLQGHEGCARRRRASCTVEKGVSTHRTQTGAHE